MQKITPFLWLDNQAEEAIALYSSLFPNVKIGMMNRKPDGTLFIGEIEILGQKLQLMNAGKHYVLTPAFSLVAICENQAEIDKYWQALSENGTIMMCGWVTDKFGITWQIIPQILLDLLSDKDAEKANRAQQAMLKMQKIDIAALLAAL